MTRPLLIALVLLSPAFLALRAPVEPLETRLKKAETAFVGTIVDLERKDGWARGFLLVEDPLKNAVVDQKIPVIWRHQMPGGLAIGGGLLSFNPDEGTRGIAILTDQHEERYWLRDDKFEPVKKLDEVRKLLAAQRLRDSPDGT